MPTNEIPQSDSVTYVDCTYYAEPPPDSLRRVFMFAARGKYRALTDSELTRIGDPTVTDFSFDQNYPNPFNPSTRIEYSLPERSHVTIEIINILGQRLKTIVDRVQSAGSYNVDWDGTDDAGNRLATGFYWYRIHTDNHSETRKMLLLK